PSPPPAPRALAARVELDRFPEVLGRSSSLRIALSAQLRSRRRWGGDDEVLEQHAQGLGLRRPRVDGLAVMVLTGLGAHPAGAPARTASRAAGSRSSPRS